MCFCFYNDMDLEKNVNMKLTNYRDNTHHHFQGEGYFDYIRACEGETLPFIITGKQVDCYEWGPMTCLEEVIVTFTDASDDFAIVYSQDGTADR